MITTSPAPSHISPRSKVRLALGLLGSSAACTVCLKLQNQTCVDHCADLDPADRKYFQQPFLQTMAMFLGGILCLLTPAIRSPGNRRRTQKQLTMEEADLDGANIASETSYMLQDAESPPVQTSQRPMQGFGYLLLWLPTTLDIVSSTMILVLFFYLPPSLMNMLHGLTVIFSGMLAAKFLDRHLSTRQYASLAIILSGVVISMLPDLLTHGEKTHVNSTPTTGRSSTRIALARVALAAVAQFLNAAQTVVEESILSRYSIRPAKIAGIEGVFGFCTMAALLVPLYYLAGARQHGGILDTPLAITQLTSSVRLSVAMAVCILGQALSYYYSLSLVKHLGATSRITIDLCKTVMVWSISLGLGWETFSYVRVLGFAVLVAGNLAYNG